MIFEKIINQDLDFLGPLQPEGWGDIVPAFKFYLESPLCFPIKTKVNEKIAGIGAAIILKDTAWLAHIIVNHENRKQGIGGAITAHLLDITREQGCKTVSLIATDLGRPVYQKIGFTEQEDYVFYEREAPLVNSNTSADIAICREEHRAGILELDRVLSGEDREQLLEPKLGGGLCASNQREDRRLLYSRSGRGPGNGRQRTGRAGSFKAETIAFQQERAAGRQ